MALQLVALAGGAVVVGVGLLVERVRRARRQPTSPPDLSVVFEQVQVSEKQASELVRAWAAGQHCVSCGNPLTDGVRAGHPVALLDPGGATREWRDVGTEQLTLALATSLPVCWTCHVSATFRRLHPELVTDRGDWPAASFGRR